MSTVRIELLYPEYNNLYGDTGNVTYLGQKLTLCGCEIEWIRTHLGDRPAFVDGAVDFLYIGPCTEEQQEREIAALLPYRDALVQRLQSDCLTLVTGNAVELFGQYIEREDGTKIEALGIVNTYAKRFSRLRFNDLCVGDYDGIAVVGFKNQLSHSYAIEDAENVYPPFLTMQVGSGRHPSCAEEGFAQNGCIATYLLGPLLPLNPVLADRLVRTLAGDAYTACTLPYEQEAYERRLEELCRKK